MNRAAVRSAARQGVATTLYRALLNTCLLVAMLHAFPGYETVSILAVLVFSQGVAGIGLTMRSIAALQSSVDDMGERKTRHAILLAADPEWLHDDNFWGEVDRRVANEFDVPPPSPWWAQIGLTLGNFLVLLVGDLVSVVIAFVIAGITQ